MSLEELDDEQLEIRKSMLETDPRAHRAPRRSAPSGSRREASGSTRTGSARWPGDVLDRRAPQGRVRLRAGDQPRPADPVPLLDLHGSAGGCAAADLVGRPDDRQPGSGSLAGGDRSRGHRGVPAAALPLARRVRGVRLRGPAAGPPDRRAAGRRDRRAHRRAVRGRPERAGVPQLLRRADDRRQRDDPAHDQPRDARADGASRAAEAAAGGARADPARDRGDPPVGDPGAPLPADRDAATSSSGARRSSAATRSSRGTRARTATRRSSPTPTRST